MIEILNSDSELNNNKRVKLFTTFLSVVLVLLILLDLVHILKNNLNLNNPLIGDSLKSEINAPHIQTAIFYSIALIIILIFNFRKQNILGIIIGSITVGIYFIIQ